MFYGTWRVKRTALWRLKSIQFQGMHLPERYIVTCAVRKEPPQKNPKKEPKYWGEVYNTLILFGEHSFHEYEAHSDIKWSQWSQLVVRNVRAGIAGRTRKPFFVMFKNSRRLINWTTQLTQIYITHQIRIGRPVLIQNLERPLHRRRGLVG